MKMTETAPPAVTDPKPADTGTTPAPAVADGTPTPDPKPAEAAPAADPKPVAEGDKWEPYEISAPEGVQVDQTQLKEFTTFANEMKIPKEKAEAFSHAFAKAQLSAVQNQIAAWRAEAEADKEIGGPQYEENVGIAKKALKKFGGDEVLDVLNKTGLGNHKDIIRTFLRVGKAMSDDVVITQTGGTPKAEPTFTSALMAIANANKQKGANT